MNENKEIKEAMNELEEMSKDEELRRVAELREKAIRDEKNGLRHARQDGIKEGKEEVARKMKKEKYPDEIIAKLTELTVEEVKNIK